MTPWVAAMVRHAVSQIGVRETSRNRGPEIDQYNHETGHDPAKRDPWCAIFVAAMARRGWTDPPVPYAGMNAPSKCPVPAVAGVWTLDERSPAYLHTQTPTEGAIFITQGHKHCGIIADVGKDGTLLTVEGNTNDNGSPEGIGVFYRGRRPGEILCYLDFSLWVPIAP